MPQTWPREFNLTEDLLVALSACFHKNCCSRHSIKPAHKKTKIWDVSGLPTSFWTTVKKSHGAALTPEGTNCPKSSFSRPWRVTTLWHFEGCSQSIPCSLDRPSAALNVSCGAVIPVLVCLFFCPCFTAQKPTRGFYSRAGEVLQLQPSCKTHRRVFSFSLPGNEFWACRLNPPQRRRKKERNDCSVSLRRIMELYSPRRILGSFILPGSARICFVCLGAWAMCWVEKTSSADWWIWAIWCGCGWMKQKREFLAAQKAKVCIILYIYYAVIYLMQARTRQC